jgi:hypothetical protein
MHFRGLFPVAVIAGLFAVSFPQLTAADTTVATAVSSRVGNGYQRERLPDGSFKTEFYALSNGGRVAGTTSDATVDKVAYPEVAEIAMRLLAGQNYRYATKAEDAKLLLVLYWGTTIGFEPGNYSTQVNNAAAALQNLKAAGGGSGNVPGQAGGFGGGGGSAESAAAGAVFEGEMFKMMSENRARDQINLPNAKLLGYLDEINSADGIQRWAGAGDRYNDLIADVEESRYYIIISAYDFPEVVKNGKKRLLWSTRVSVRAPGNRFDDSVMAMMKSAAKYFGQNSGKLIRGEESKGTVEMGDVKFLGEAQEPKPEASSPSTVNNK